MKTNKLLIIASLGLVSLLSLPSQAKGESDSLSLKNCNLVITDKNATVSLSYPQLVGSKQDTEVAQNINRVVFQTLVDGAPIKYAEKVNSNGTMELFCRAVAAGLASYGKERTLEAMPLDFYSTWWAFGNKYVVTIYIEKYTFVGGAHGHTMGTFLNFNAQTGAKLDVKIVDTVKLLEIAASQFCRERRLPKDAMRIQTGLSCELADLPMPKQMGFSNKGLVLHYNQYEIAPYVFGQIVITIPYKYFKDLIADDFMVSSMRSGGGQMYNQKLKEQKESGRTPKF